jgi:hypothetical protein
MDKDLLDAVVERSISDLHLPSRPVMICPLAEILPLSIKENHIWPKTQDLHGWSQNLGPASTNPSVWD